PALQDAPDQDVSVRHRAIDGHDCRDRLWSSCGRRLERVLDSERARPGIRPGPVRSARHGQGGGDAQPIPPSHVRAGAHLSPPGRWSVAVTTTAQLYHRAPSPRTTSAAYGIAAHHANRVPRTAILPALGGTPFWPTSSSMIWNVR